MQHVVARWEVLLLEWCLKPSAVVAGLRCRARLEISDAGIGGTEHALLHQYGLAQMFAKISATPQEPEPCPVQSLNSATSAQLTFGG